MIKIRKIKVEKTKVYDLTIPNTENFYANNLLVHNCTEILLATDEYRTAVCCISSVNAEYYDEWKDNKQFHKDVAEMLDNALTIFIKKAPLVADKNHLKRALFSAKNERSIGIGLLGFHAYLQSKGIPFESALAKSINMKMFKGIREKLDIANLELGEERGSPKDCKKTGRRFAHVMAVAPNASSSIILQNTSPSVEPYKANAYRQDTLSGSGMNRNRFLDILIKKKMSENASLNYDNIWSSILSNDGSVQHLNFLDQNEKDTFKTALEIDQRWIIEHAADRQPFIDQGQSINTYFRPNVDIKYLHAVHFMAWQRGLKTLYYCRSEKIGKSEKIAKKIERQFIKDYDVNDLINGESCLACE